MIIDVEYEPSTRADRIARKSNQIYEGIGLRPSDGFTVLKIRAPGATKNHNIQVGQVHAVTIDGRRHELETPWDRWRLREQELRKLLDGDFSEPWADDYFDPASPRYFKRDKRIHTPAPTVLPDDHGKFEAICILVVLAIGCAIYFL